LTPGDETAIREKMQELMQKRKVSQPLDLPSAGSAFKRPVGGFAAALIDQAGLKGFQIGGAGVSQKHAGFVVNLGGATAADVLQLLGAVSDKVFDFSVLSKKTPKTPHFSWIFSDSKSIINPPQVHHFLWLLQQVVF
jgi:UDP-N-acetylmuramate dehydrogenase